MAATRAPFYIGFVYNLENKLLSATIVYCVAVEMLTTVTRSLKYWRNTSNQKILKCWNHYSGVQYNIPLKKQNKQSSYQGAIKRKNIFCSQLSKLPFSAAVLWKLNWTTLSSHSWRSRFLYGFIRLSHCCGELLSPSSLQVIEVFGSLFALG